MSKEVKDFVKEIVGIFIVAFVLAMVLRAFVVEGRIIPTGSMLPTLQLQDRVMVNKFIYRFKEPVRGDIVVFEPPESLHADMDYIKRVIGLPGEIVEISNGTVYIDGRQLIEPYLYENIDYTFGPVLVPDDSLLVLGDNRNQSFDSHMWESWLTQDRVKGKAFMIYWPILHIQLLEGEVHFYENTGNQ